MNLVIASMLLLAMLAFQPTLIYGAKKNIASAGKSNRNPASSLNAERKIKSSKHGKRHSSEAFEGPLYSPALSASSKLVLSLGSGDVLVRAARGAAAASAVDKQNPTPVIATGSSNNGGGGGKRQRAGNGKKSNRNSAVRENRQASSESFSPSNGGRKHLDKKFSLATGLNAGTDQQAGGGGKGKQQRQMLKSQNHQRKRSGNKAIRDEANAGESDKTRK